MYPSPSATLGRRTRRRTTRRSWIRTTAAGGIPLSPKHSTRPLAKCTRNAPRRIRRRRNDDRSASHTRSSTGSSSRVDGLRLGRRPLPAALEVAPATTINPRSSDRRRRGEVRLPPAASRRRRARPRIRGPRTDRTPAGPQRQAMAPRVPAFRTPRSRGDLVRLCVIASRCHLHSCLVATDPQSGRLWCKQPACQQRALHQPPGGLGRIVHRAGSARQAGGVGSTRQHVRKHHDRGEPVGDGGRARMRLITPCQNPGPRSRAPWGTPRGGAMDGRRAAASSRRQGPSPARARPGRHARGPSPVTGDRRLRRRPQRRAGPRRCVKTGRAWCPAPVPSRRQLAPRGRGLGSRRPRSGSCRSRGRARSPSGDAFHTAHGH